MAQVAPHSGGTPAAPRRTYRPPAGIPAPSPSQDVHRHRAGTEAPEPWYGTPPPTHGSSLITSLQRRVIPARGRHATGYGQNFERVIGWTLLGSLVPGTGLLAAGRRTSGLVAISLGSLAASLVMTFLLAGNPMALLRSFVSQPDRFLVLAVGLAVLVLLWAAMVIATYAATRRYAHLGTRHRVVSLLTVTALIALVALPTAKVGSYSLIMRDTLTGIFGNTASAFAGAGPDNSNTADPWANTARVNVLLIGSDAGADRIGIRPDTLILASINTQTGDTVLFSLPRNLQKVPFPPGTRQAAEYPYGFDCVDANGVPQCLLNAFWTFGEEHWQDYYPDEPDAFHAGLRATSEAVEQITGLPVDQYTMLNLRGFMQFVDAIGGITVNVRERLPIGGSSENPVASGWIKPGPNQHLGGYKALWYARSRWSTDDYDRMRRQRCVIGAVVQQADPASVALAFPEIAAAAKDNVTTGIPLADLGAWVTLTQKVQKTQVRSLPFTSKVIDPQDPDIALMRTLVGEAINPKPAPSGSSAAPSAGVSSGGAGTPSDGGSSAPGTPTTDPEQDRQAQDVTSVC